VIPWARGPDSLDPLDLYSHVPAFEFRPYTVSNQTLHATTICIEIQIELTETPVLFVCVGKVNFT